MRSMLFAMVLVSGFVTGATDQKVRFVCTNDVGEPDRAEVDFARKTVLEFNQHQPGGAFIAEDTSAPATIDKTTIRWPDTFDGTTYSIDRATGVLKKWFEGTAIYTKQCRELPSGSAWQ